MNRKIPSETKVNSTGLLGRLKSRGAYEFNILKAKGLYESVRLFSDRMVQRFCLSRFRTAMRPSLDQLSGIARSMHMSAIDLVGAAFPEITSSELNKIKEEYSLIRSELERRCEAMRGSFAYPEWYAIERETSFIYYAVCRHLAPNNILETGIANGHSTFFLLQAMKRNGKGFLHSVDIADNVGKLLTDEDREHWKLHVLGSPQRRSFSNILESASPIDLFIHDSDHTYGWQMFEYRIAQKALGQHGILLSDDIDHSLAFVDFCAENNRDPILLIDTRKVTGLLLPEN